MAKTKANVDPALVLTGKEVAKIGGGAQAVQLGGVTYEVVSQVNVPTLKQEDQETVAVKFIQPILEKPQYTDKIVEVDGEKRVVKEERIINIGRVIELSSGQVFEYVCNAMTADHLRAAYPNHGYVGRCFGIQKVGKVAGKLYKQTNIVEIAPAGAPTADQAAGGGSPQDD